MVDRRSEDDGNHSPQALNNADQSIEAEKSSSDPVVVIQ